MSVPRRDRRILRLLAALFLANGAIVVGGCLVTLGLFALSMSGGGPAATWMEIVPGAMAYGVFAGQVLMLSLVGALVEKARWSVWLAAIPFALLLALGFVVSLIGPALYSAVVMSRVDEIWVLSLTLVSLSILPIIICYGSLLLMSIILWPLKIFAGWRLARDDEPTVSVRSAPVSRLMLWIGLWAALFLLATRSAERFGEDGIFVALIGGLVILFTGVPVIFLANGRRLALLRWCVAVAYLLMLSYGESELIYWVTKPSGFTTVGRVLMVVLSFNAPLAGIVAMNCLILRMVGLRLEMPLVWRAKKATEGVPAAGATAHAGAPGNVAVGSIEP